MRFVGFIARKVSLEDAAVIDRKHQVSSATQIPKNKLLKASLIARRKTITDFVTRSGKYTTQRNQFVTLC